MEVSTREKLAYVCHGLVGLMSWVYIALHLLATEEGKFALTWIVGLALLTVVPVVLVIVAFVTGFFFGPTRLLSLLMPFLIYGLIGGYEDYYVLFMLPYAVLSVGIWFWWMNRKIPPL